MNKDNLKRFTISELIETKNRVEITVEELKFCIQTLEEEGDELLATNNMLACMHQTLIRNLNTASKLS